MNVTGESKGEARRANAEILFIAILTASIVTVGAAGVTFATDSASDTSEQMDQPEFTHDGLDLVYEDGPILSHNDETERIRVIHRDKSITVYNDSVDWDLEPGDVLMSSGWMSEEGIDSDSTVEIAWDRKNEESEIVEEIYIPDEGVSGSDYTSGDEDVDVEDPDLPGFVS